MKTIFLYRILPRYQLFGTETPSGHQKFKTSKLELTEAKKLTRTGEIITLQKVENCIK